MTLTEFKTAYTDMSRPTAVYLSAMGLVYAIVKSPTIEMALVLAGIITGVSYLRSQDKRLGVGQSDKE